MLRRDFYDQSLSLSAVSLLAQANDLECDIAIIGASVGGCAAALAAARNGLRARLLLQRIIRSD